MLWWAQWQHRLKLKGWWIGQTTILQINMWREEWLHPDFFLERINSFPFKLAVLALSIAGRIISKYWRCTLQTYFFMPPHSARVSSRTSCTMPGGSTQVLYPPRPMPRLKCGCLTSWNRILPIQASSWWNQPRLVFSMFITAASNLPGTRYGFNTQTPSV